MLPEEVRGGAASHPLGLFLYAALLAFAHRARCAAAIRLAPCRRDRPLRLRRPRLGIPAALAWGVGSIQREYASGGLEISAATRPHAAAKDNQIPGTARFPVA
jgi:hypothetical protein